MFNRKSPSIHPSIATELNTQFNEHEMSALSSLGTIIDLDANQLFAAEGSFGREAVVVISGTALVQRDGATIAEVGAGTILGEVSLLTNEPRNASLMTTSATRLAVMDRREFASFLDSCPRIEAQVKTLVAERTA